MTTPPLDWTTTEMLANADAHQIEQTQVRAAFATVMPGLVLRGLYEVDRDTGTIQRRSPILYPAGVL